MSDEDVSEGMLYLEFVTLQMKGLCESNKVSSMAVLDSVIYQKRNLLTS